MLQIKSLASGSSGNCYHVSDGNSSILIECGIPFKKIQQGIDFKTSELDGCLISHFHGDHSKAVNDLLKAGVDCFVSKETRGVLNILGHRVHTVESHECYKVGAWEVYPFPSEHDCPGSLGFLIAKGDEKLLYLTDSFYCRFRFKGLTRIMIEANYSAEIINEQVAAGAIEPARKNRTLRSHMSLDTLKDFFAANDLSAVTEIWLLHLSDSNSDEKLFKEEIQRATGKIVRIA